MPLLASQRRSTVQYTSVTVHCMYVHVCTTELAIEIPLITVHVQAKKSTIIERVCFVHNFLFSCVHSYNGRESLMKSRIGRSGERRYSAVRTVYDGINAYPITLSQTRCSPLLPFLFLLRSITGTSNGTSPFYSTVQNILCWEGKYDTIYPPKLIPCSTEAFYGLKQCCTVYSVPTYCT